MTFDTQLIVDYSDGSGPVYGLTVEHQDRGRYRWALTDAGGREATHGYEDSRGRADAVGLNYLTRYETRVPPTDWWPRRFGYDTMSCPFCVCSKGGEAFEPNREQDCCTDGKCRCHE